MLQESSSSVRWIATTSMRAMLGVLMLSVVVGVGSGDSTVAQEMERGFTATHSPTDAPFQPILSDPSGTFYLGFLRVGSSLLDLAVLHLPSSFPVWRATPARPALWSSPVSLSFNGSLLLAHPDSGLLLWSSSSGVGGDGDGDRVVILASSDLQIRKDGGGGGGVAWRSFDFPADTVVQNQNFTSGMSLFSPGRRFSMRLGTNYIGLYFVSGGATTMYWRHTALEARAQVEPGGAPLYMRVDPDGFLGMYQNGSDPADVVAFNTFNRNMTEQFRRLTLEDDANLHAYYWSGTGWVGEYTAIADACEIPTTCGAYSVCRPGAGAGAGAHQCTCLANGTDGCLATPTGDFCGNGSGSGGGGTEFTVLRRSRVDLGNKEIMSPRAAGSVDECEGSCARNCSCWGAIYSNATNTCYQVDYPVQLLLQGDEWHVGYFKVRSNGGGGGGGSNGDEGSKGRRRAKVALLVVGSLLLVAAAGFGAYKVWGRRRAIGVDGEGLAPRPYKDLGKASFKSIEIELASSSSSSPPHS